MLQKLFAPTANEIIYSRLYIVRIVKGFCIRQCSEVLISNKNVMTYTVIRGIESHKYIVTSQAQNICKCACVCWCVFNKTRFWRVIGRIEY